MLICGQFIAKDVKLWSTLLFVRFEKLNFSDFWGPLNLLGPSKKSQLLDSWPLSMPLKTRTWMNLFKIFVLYLMLSMYLLRQSSLKDYVCQENIIWASFRTVQFYNNCGSLVPGMNHANKYPCTMGSKSIWTFWTFEPNSPY